MKKWLAAVCLQLLAVVPASAQTAYTVKGQAPQGIKKVYLVDILNRYTPIDSTDVAAGKFNLNGTQEADAILGISDGAYVVPFINDGTPVSVDMSNYTLKGSAQNEKLNAYDLELEPYERQMKDIMQQARSGQMNKEQMDSLEHVFMALSEKREARLIEIILGNPDNMIPVVYASDMAYSMDYEQLSQLCDPSRVYYNHPAMKLPRRLKDGLEKRAPGKLFTDMTIPDMDGREHKLSEWIGHGQYVLIDFWASWCGPCRGEMPNVVANYEKYHAKGFEIIGISFDQKADPWKSAVKQMNMTWPQLSDLGGWQSAAAGVYGISSIPASILFDGTGRIIATDLRGEKLGEKLSQLYQ